MQDLYKQILIYSLAILIGLAILGIIVLIAILIIKKNEEYIKNIDEQIRGMREAEKEQIKEVQKCLNTLKKRYDSIRQDIKHHEQQRGKLIEGGYIAENTPQFTFKTMNYRRVMEASFSLLHECMDDKEKPSAEIVCSFVKVMDQTIDQERNRYLVQDGRSYAFTMHAEASQLKKLEEKVHTQFPTFGNAIVLDESPKNYDDKKAILFCSKKQIESAEKYLKENHRKINIEGPMRVIRQANLAIESQKLEEIEVDDDSAMSITKELKNNSMMMLNKLNEALLTRVK